MSPELESEQKGFFPDSSPGPQGSVPAAISQRRNDRMYHRHSCLFRYRQHWDRRAPYLQACHNAGMTKCITGIPACSETTNQTAKRMQNGRDDCHVVRHHWDRRAPYLQAYDNAGMTKCITGIPSCSETVNQTAKRLHKGTDVRGRARFSETCRAVALAKEEPPEQKKCRLQ